MRNMNLSPLQVELNSSTLRNRESPDKLTVLTSKPVTALQPSPMEDEEPEPYEPIVLPEELFLRR